MFYCKVLEIGKMGKSTGWPLKERHFKRVNHIPILCIYLYYIKNCYLLSPPFAKEKNKNFQSAFCKCERCVFFATANVKGCLFQCCDAVCILGRGHLNPPASVPETLGSRTGVLSTGGPAVTSGDLVTFLRHETKSGIFCCVWPRSG